MTYPKLDVTQALIDLAASVSQDPDEADWFDVEELLDLLPNPSSVLRDLIYTIHQEYL